MCAVAALLIVPASAGAVNPVSFSSVGNMTVKREYPGAARLPDGRILIVGGYNSVDLSLKSAEIFDPTTNSFTSTGVGNLATARREAAGATLPDGRALVAGGFNDDGALASAEVLSVPSNAFNAKLKGNKVIFKVSNEGVATTTDTSNKPATIAKKKKPKLVKTKSKHGGPGKIEVKVKLTKAGSAKLSQKGKLTIRITYTPDRGLAATRKLKLRAGK